MIAMDTALPLYSAAQVKALDARAIREFRIEGYTLMQRAAGAALAELRQAWPRAHRLVVLAGPGNNGGDALDLARQAAAQGLMVDCFLLAEPASLKGEAAEAWQAFQQAGLRLQALPDLEAALAAADVAVDGLLGTGLSRAVSGHIAAVIDRLNASDCPVLALDLPSGLGADTGAVLGCAVEAELTVSFIGRKQGLYTGPARNHTGRIAFSDLAVPPAVYEGNDPAAWLLDPAALRGLLPRRRPDTHKGSYGHVLAVGGAPGYSGAIRLCGQAALRGGAGLVSVITHPASALVVGLAQPELMVRGIEAEDAACEEMLSRASVIAAGPGLGRLDWSQAWLDRLLTAARPLVLDADALNLLTPGQSLPPDTIVTPHPGEAARLLNCSASDIQRDRLQAANRLVSRLGCVVVLKGAGSIVASPAGDRWVCAAGNPGMAVGGMGDLLTGLIAALRAQGLSAANAACVGVQVHALAGDAAARHGERGLLPSDLLPQFRQWLNP